MQRRTSNQTASVMCEAPSHARLTPYKPNIILLDRTVCLIIRRAARIIVSLPS
jgi:hypothetical protein